MIEKGHIMSAIIILCLTVALNGQDFTGGHLQHLYTGGLTVIAGTDESLQQTAFSFILDRADVFNTQEDLLIATALMDFGSPSLPHQSSNLYSLHIQISQPRMNANRNTFIFDLELDSDLLNNPPLRLPVTHIGISFIIVGSDFQGSEQSSTSSLIFARNGLMNTVADSVYDFKNQNSLSPFFYDSSTNTKGCGGVKVGSQWILQPIDCEIFYAHIFITGFQQLSTNDGTSHPKMKPSFGGTNNIAVNLKTSGQAVFSTNSAIDGIPVTFDGALDYQRVQLSMVAIGIRQYSSADYPYQAIRQDTFIHYTTSSLESTATFDTDTGQLSLSVAASYPTTEPDYWPNPIGYGSQSIANRFCGLASFNLAYEVDGGGSLTGTDITQFFVEEINLSSSVDSQVFAVIGRGETDTIILDASTDLLVYGCLMVTAKNACNQKIQVVQLDTNPTSYSLSSTSTSNTNQFLSSHGNTVDYSSSQDPNLLDIGSGLIDIQQTTIQPGTYTYILHYNGIENKAYEGILHIGTEAKIPDPIDANIPNFNQSIRLQVFGTVVYEGTFGINSATETIHFGFFNFLNPIDNQVKIQYTTDYNGADDSLQNSFRNFLQFGLVQNQNVLAEDGQCSSTCATTSGYTTGINYYTVPPTCVSCDPVPLIEFAPQNGTCDCLEHYQEVAGFCQACGIALCDQCTLQNDYCFRCVGNAVFVNEDSTGMGCQCEEGYYQDDVACKQCAEGCLTCTNPNSCTTCQDHDGTRLSPSQNCACMTGYYQNNNPICGKCSSQCLTCSGTASNCLTCDTDKHFQKQGTTCRCELGYYLLLNEGIAQCNKCDISCISCADQIDKCIDCAALREKTTEGKCVCMEGYTQVDGICIDSECQSIDPYCQKCGIILTTSEPICQACAGQLRVLSQDNKTCECRSGYYAEDSNCLPCGAGCSQCTSPNNCETCAILAYKIGDGTCRCPPSTYLQDQNGQLICQRCERNCQACSGASDNCSSCINGFQVVDNRCVCPSGFYPSPDNYRCLMCSFGCASCMNATQCSFCREGYLLSSGICTMNCPTGFFPAADECRQCSANCQNCISSLNCKGCRSGYFLFGGVCKETCPDGTYSLGNLCIACQQPCATCQFSAEICTSCIDGMIYSAGKCHEECPNRQYFNGQSCQPCSTICQNCESRPDNCVSCQSGRYLVNGQCLSECPFSIVDGICTQTCPPITYLNGNTCSPCISPCLSCTGPTTCTSCSNNLYAFNGTCLISCPPQTLTIDNYCATCDASCIGCVANPSSCIDCSSGFYWLGDKCVDTCPVGYFISSSESDCLPCDAGCRFCTGPGQCQACQDSTVSPISGQCSNRCGSNCLECKNEVCSKCAAGTAWSGLSCVQNCPARSFPVNGRCVCQIGFLHQNQCINSCPEQFVGLNKQCIACSSPCKTCSTTPTKCSTCIDGYDLDEISRQCIEDTPCLYGRYKSVFSDCRTICPEGQYFLDNACLSGGCPTSYSIDSGNRACIKQNVPSGCTEPYYLQGSRCVYQCDRGFFPNTLKRVCESCSANCNTCSDKSTCSTCLPGYQILNGACIISNPCSNGFLKYKGQCLQSCPTGNSEEDGFCVRNCAEGTYFYNGGCYSSCPTPLQTEDACVFACPRGTIQNGDICQHNNTNCQNGQFYNSFTGACNFCRFPCSQCEGLASTCTACQPNYLLAGSSCRPGGSCPIGTYSSLSGCQPCPQKCGACTSSEECVTCASGYVNNGADCIQSSNDLIPVQLQVLNTYARDQTFFAEIKPTIIPNSLPNSIASQFLLLIPDESQTTVVVRTWIQGLNVIASLTYPVSIPVYNAYLILNSNLLSSIYQSMGYSTANSIVLIQVTPSAPLSPNNFMIPGRVQASTSVSVEQLKKGKVYSVLNQAAMAKALKLGRDNIKWT